ncbi:hypothetical protein FJT64_011272 [Amphibalanus amphitrite]|uniref:MYND-type domain-containing protein n=1 Tax=Amphibalanus amphitrite TaxID=1232801 RepID=A0A6A4VA84_AMPAM|nr:hypothetical protein FJT64_011272 [Amphibalanus amphitrite]
MDSEPGCCWRCGEPAQGMCPMCHLALYCSNTCLQDDRASHLSECDEAASTELPCAYCGRMSRELSRCARCHLAGYCSRECGELDGRRHLPACLAGRDAVLRLANRLSHDAEPFRLPVYFGDGVHALNLLRNTDQRGEEPCQVLQLSAQLPHLLRTAADVSESRRPLLATLASDSGHQLARAYLLLYLLAREARPEAIVQVMYSLRLSAEHARLLQAALEQLVTATYTQLLQLVPWVRIGRAALSHWQEVWRAWLHAMQDAGCLARMERCRDAAMAEPETAAKLERYLGALPEGQQRSARDFLLGHGTLIGDRQRRAAADCANVTLLALNPRESRHREAFSDLRLGSNPPAWLERAAGADTVLAPAPVPAGPLADWDRAEVQRALGADADPLEGCRMLAEDGAEAAEARAIAGQLSVRLVQFSSLSELDELLADLRFERVFTADATDRLGLFAVLEMAEVLLAPVPHSMIVTSHSRWATLLPPAGTALSALRGSGSMHWDREMDKEKFRIQTYLQAERLAAAFRRRSGRLSMDKEFFEMRAQLALHNGGHHNNEAKRAPPGSDSEGPTIDLSPGQHSAPAARAAPDRARLRSLPLDPDILVARAREERPATGQRALDSPTTPPSSPSSVLSRTGRPGSIRQRVRELERSVAESPRSPEQQSAPEPFSRTDRPGSVRDKVRRFEMTQRGELPAAAQQADDGEGSPVTLRRRTRHQPHAAGSSRDTTPSPPDLISWPCTTDDEVADARNAEPRATSAAEPPPRQRSASQRSGHSSPSAYETANETSFTQRESAGELGEPELAAAGTQSLDGSVGTEVDPQNDDVFTDASGMPAPVTSTVTSL